MVLKVGEALKSFIELFKIVRFVFEFIQIPGILQ